MTWQPTMVTLYDGRQVLSDSLEWREECEARAVLALPFEHRGEFFAGVAKRRGLAGMEALKRRCFEVEPYFVLAMPTKDLRNAYADKVALKFGPAARTALQEKVRAIWRAQQEQAKPEEAA